MAYDPTTEEVILYGGEAPKPGGLFADTWTWDMNGWRHAAGAARPESVPNSWDQADPPVSVNRLTRAQVLSSAAMPPLSFDAGSDRRLETKLLRVRTVLQIEPEFAVDSIQPGNGPYAQPGRLEWVVVLFCDPPSYSACAGRSLGGPAPYPGQTPAPRPTTKWLMTTIDPLGSNSDMGVSYSGGTTDSPRGWEQASDLYQG